jgi:preprotein translocase subunit SecE
VARDRQRAKQRKQRREPTPSKRDEGNGVTPEPNALHRENVPPSVEHAGDVDEFEAALVAGAEGEPESDPDAADRAAVGDGGDEVDATTAPPPPPGTRTATHPGEDAHGRGGSRFLNFLRASWAELQRVQWPDRRQVGQATLVVLGFVLVAGAFLGAADWVAQQLVDFIL